MFKKISDINIDPDEPFKNDVLNRKPYADALTNLISSISQPTVVSINGSWGTGKSTFIKILIANLIKKEFICIYFNAWNNDFTEQPFISFVLEIEEEILKLQLKGSKINKIEKIIKNLKSYSGKILKYTLPLAVRLYSAGMININPETDSEIDKTLTKAVEDKLVEYSEMKLAISSFKEQLIKLSEECANINSPKPIIFFIDELDRCRPSYAIRLLENIKHLFDVSGFVFVLGIDREQLGYTVQSFYGQGMDSNGYLKKFIDIEYPLPNPTIENYTKFLINKLNLSHEFFKSRKEGIDELENISGSFIGLSKFFQSSLRVQNQCMSQINRTIRTIPNDQFSYPNLLTYLIIFKHLNPDTFNFLIENKEYDKFILEIESKDRGKEFRTTNNWYLIKASLLFSKSYSINDDVGSLIDNLIGKSKAINNSTSYKRECERIASILGYYRTNVRGDIIKYLISYINIVDIPSHHFNSAS